MSELLSFPGLGLEFEINRVAFMLGTRPVYWYGIIIAASFLAASAYMLSRCKDFGLDGDRVMDVILGAVLLGIVGARTYYVLFKWDTYRENPVSVFYVWEGGIAIYGGIIGGLIAAILICKWRKVKLLPMLDLAACGLLLGQAVGRWGNFVNMEAFGRNTNAAWGMTSPSIVWYLQQNSRELSRLGVSVDPSVPVHPTFFYESVWCFLGFLFMAWFTKKRRFDGELWLIYLGWYGLGRFFIEGLRTDSLLIGTMRVSQVLAMLCVVASLLTLTAILSKIKRANDPEFMMLYVQTEESKAVLAGKSDEKSVSESDPAGDATDTGKGSEDSEPEPVRAEDTENMDVTDSDEQGDKADGENN